VAKIPGINMQLEIVDAALGTPGELVEISVPADAIIEAIQSGQIRYVELDGRLVLAADRDWLMGWMRDRPGKEGGHDEG